MNPTRWSNIRSKSSIVTKRQHINTRKSSKLMYEAGSGLLKATDEDQKCSPLLKIGTSGTSSEASTKIRGAYGPGGGLGTTYPRICGHHLYPWVVWLWWGTLHETLSFDNRAAGPLLPNKLRFKVGGPKTSLYRVAPSWAQWIICQHCQLKHRKNIYHHKRLRMELLTKGQNVLFRLKNTTQLTLKQCLIHHLIDFLAVGIRHRSHWQSKELRPEKKCHVKSCQVIDDMWERVDKSINIV